MKRFVCLICALLILFFNSVLCFNSFADDYIDPQGAKTLVKNARDIIKSFPDDFQWFQAEDTYEYDNIIVNSYLDYIGQVNLKRVREGYYPEEVKQFIKDTFTKAIADNYLISQDAERFFQRYHFENGKYFYPYYMGAQERNHTALFLTDENSLK